MSEAAVAEPEVQVAPAAPEVIPSVPDPIEAEAEAFIEALHAPGRAEEPELVAAREAAVAATREQTERETRERIVVEQREATQKREAEASRLQFEQNYNDRRASVAKLKDELTEAGVDGADLIAQRIINAFEQHHADGLQLHEPTVRREIQDMATQQVNDGFRAALGTAAVKFFGPQEDKKYPDMVAALNTFKEIVLEGTVTETEAKAREKSAVLAYHRELEQAKKIVGAQSGQTVDGLPGGGGGPLTPESYAKRMAQGEEPSADEIDAMTRQYL